MQSSAPRRRDGSPPVWRAIGTVALILAVLVAGCAGGVGSTGTPETTGTTTAETGTTVDTTGSTTGGAERSYATVDRVIDGDTVVVTFENGTEETVRLLGVDAPETSTRNDPGEYEGVPDTAAGRDCLDAWGDLAHAVAIEALSGERVRIVFDERSDRRGYYGRLLAYVYVDGESFNYRLVDEGYARVYESDFTELDRYHEAEATAMRDGRGLWECRTPDGSTATPTDGRTTTTTDGRTTTTTDGTSTDDTTAGEDAGLVVAATHFDAAGNDHENLNDEYVTFRNDGTKTLSLSGWTVADEAGHTYTFPDGTTLDPGETLTLYTGEGTDSPGVRYWGASRAIWNNGGDTIVVRDQSGSVVLTHRATPSLRRPGDPSLRRPGVSPPLVSGGRSVAGIDAPRIPVTRPSCV